MIARTKFIEGKILSGRVYAEFFPFSKTDIVLNIGCGYGPQAIVYTGHYQHMIGIDIMFDRLQVSNGFGLPGYAPIGGNVEQIPVASATMDKAIAIDIIEHVQSPRNLCDEIYRVLKPGGHALFTFPAMHDNYTALISMFTRTALRRKRYGSFHDKPEIWHPDAHNQSYPVEEWINLVTHSGFKMIESRATTLFPPLHLYGIPRFWFKNEFIHKVDSYLSKQPILKNYGQALMAVFEKE